MANLSITAANVKITNDNLIRNVFAGEAITTGALVFLDVSDDKYYNANTAALASAPLDVDGSLYGIALNQAAADGHPLAIARTGATVDFGAATSTINEHWFGAASDGVISDTEAANGEFGIAVGFATSTSAISLNFQGSGVDAP